MAYTTSDSNKPDSQAIVQRVARVLEGKQASLHEPSFIGNEIKYVCDCIESTYVSSVGEYVDRFESDLAEYTGAKYAVAVMNGTAALHIALKLSGVVSGDEVLIPAFTFVATANAIKYCGAIPHFVDSDSLTLGINIKKLEKYMQHEFELKDGSCYNRVTGRRIAGIVPVHIFGHIGDMDGLIRLATKYNLAIIEDAAEALGSFYNGRHAGTLGKVGILSFNGNKIITTGGGGALLFDDSELAKFAKHITTTAKVPHQWNYIHNEVGFNYRMPNINAALGCAQLELLPELVKDKRSLFKTYSDALDDLVGVSIIQEPPNCISNYWLNALRLLNPCIELRDSLIEKFYNVGVGVRPAWTLLHKLSMYADCPKMDLAGAISLENSIINLPSSAFLAHRR